MENKSNRNAINVQSPLIEHSAPRPVNIGFRKTELNCSPGARLWKSALTKIKYKKVDLDPWHDFPVDSVCQQTAIRHRYSAIKKRWIKDEIQIKIEEKPFDRGAMRECFRMKKLSLSGEWNSASNYVAKRYLSSVKSSVYLDDVRLQMEVKLWAEAFNRQNPPKKIDVFQMSVIEILPKMPMDTERRSSITTLNATTSNAVSEPESQYYHIERYMEGEYRKYNSNSGFVDEHLRNTPHAFSHFTFERSGHRLLVVDIQGVGDLYTDPQIHTVDGLGYNDGNLGLRGMALFFHTHRCNPLCAWLGLTPFDLSESEQLQLLDGSETVQDDDTNDVSSNESEDDDLENESNISFPESPFEKCTGQNHTISPLKVQARKRSLSFGVLLTNNSYTNSSYRNYRSSFGPTVVRDNEIITKSRHRTFSGSVNGTYENTPLPLDVNISNLNLMPLPDNKKSASDDFRMTNFRYRQSSGDSGVALFHVKKCTQTRRHSNTESECGKSESLASESLNDSSPQMNSEVFSDAEYNSFWPSYEQACISPNDQQFPIPRQRIRTSSESSDLDDVEAVRMAANNFHQVLHETQKPSSACHPSNLDQEIGQSSLGQIHHELARLHEAGRFLKRPGGWSKTGLGGHGLYDNKHASSTEVVANIDWTSVLFHERQAAQLGCLEALIIMAHYYLGLPAALLSDCPIKATEEDHSLGVDYLWRSSEGGDRRCMILLARYLDASVFFGSKTTTNVSDWVALKSTLNLLTTPIDTFAVLTGHTVFPIPLVSVASGSPGPWAEALVWYKRAIESAGKQMPGFSSSSDDEGCDAEGRYDAAEDLLPVHRLLARLAEMYMIGGNGIAVDCNMSGDLFGEAAELVMKQQDGRLASTYFELSEEAYARAEDNS